MHSLTRRTALAGGSAFAATAALAACGGKGSDVDTEEAIASPDDNVITDTDEPKVVKEKTTVNFMTGRYPTTAEDWDEVGCVQLAEDTTNLHVDFGLVPSDSIGEKVNLALASGEYKEVFYRASISTGDIAKYADQKVFIPLDDLIDKYMPNFKKILEDNPNIRDGLTMPDGHIYSLPQIYDKDFDGMRYMFKLWARKDWLDSFGMDVPTTLDEYEDYLDQCVNGDPLGDGKKSTVGYGSAGIGGLIDSLSGAFGLRNQGTDVGNVDEDPDNPGKVRFWVMAEGYRDLLRYLNKLYKKGLIIKDVFSVEGQKADSLASDGKVGSAFNQSPAGYFGKEGENYVPIPPLAKSSGDTPKWVAVRSEVVSIGQFLMTDKCEHPIEIARWMDWWYSEEGSRAFFMGVEGESYEKKGKGYELLPEITKDKSIDEGLEPYALYLGGRYPGRATDEWFKGVETTKQAMEGANLVKEHALKEVWPQFTFTAEESEMLSTQGQDIDKHIDESRSAFVTGKKSLDDDWDAYIAEFDNMGVDEYLKAYQDAYDRRNK
jgi:putative aldouronate transport system substrate-binding protein